MFFCLNRTRSNLLDGLDEVVVGVMVVVGVSVVAVDDDATDDGVLKPETYPVAVISYHY